MRFGFRSANKDHVTGYLFPGQGVQFVGMGRGLYDESIAAREVFDEVDTALNRSISKLMFEGPEEVLRETKNAQPAIMTASLAALKAMYEKLGEDSVPRPVLMAGHSLGEYTSLPVAGVLGIGDAALLVEERGRLMQEACERKPGSMAAVLGLDLVIMEALVKDTGAYISNVNTQEQIVISGETSAVARACDKALYEGAKKAIPLKVAGAFHSRLMSSASEGLVEVVDRLDFKDPSVPIVANGTGKPIATAEEIKGELITQISSCVQWSRSIHYMIETGISWFIEIGPGRTLSSMVKRIDGSVKTDSVSDMSSIVKLLRNG